MQSPLHDKACRGMLMTSRQERSSVPPLRIHTQELREILVQSTTEGIGQNEELTRTGRWLLKLGTFTPCGFPVSETFQLMWQSRCRL